MQSRPPGLAASGPAASWALVPCWRLATYQAAAGVPGALGVLRRSAPPVHDDHPVHRDTAEEAVHPSSLPAASQLSFSSL